MKIVNDAAMQALGSFGAASCSSSAWERVSDPRSSSTARWCRWNSPTCPTAKAFEDYVGERALKRDGKREWRKQVFDVVARLKDAAGADDVVIGAAT